MSDPGFDIVRDLDVLGRLETGDGWPEWPGDAPGEYVPPVVRSQGQADNGVGPAEGEHTWHALAVVALSVEPPEPPAVGDLLYLGRRHVLSGEAEAGKSMLLLAVAADELLAGHGVIWVDTDDMGPGAILERLRHFGVGDDRIARLFAYLRPEEALEGAARDYLLSIIEFRAVRLVVFDAFNATLSLHGLDPSSTVDVERFLRRVVTPLCAAGPAVALPDHVVKRSEERGKYAYGSERKQTGVDVHIGMKLIEPAGRGRRGKSKLIVHKDRPGFLERPSPGLFVLDSDAGTGRLSWRIEADHETAEDGAWRPTAYMEKVSRHLELVQEPRLRTQIASRDEGIGGKAEYVRAAIDRLIAEGFAEESAGPRGARLVRLLGVYREDEEGAE